MDHKTLRFSLIPAEQADVEAGAVRQRLACAKREERRSLGRNTLRERGEPATIMELAAAMGITYRSAWLLVREMVAAREIEEVASANSGIHDNRKASAYHLKTDESGDVY